MPVRSCFHKGKGPTIAIEKWTLRPLVGWSYINDNDRIYQASCNWPFQTCEKGTCRAWLQSAKPNVCKVKPIDRRPCQQFDEVIIWSSSLWTGFLLFIHAGASQVALDLSAVTSYECLLYTHVLIWLHICPAAIKKILQSFHFLDSNIVLIEWRQPGHCFPLSCRSSVFVMTLRLHLAMFMDLCLGHFQFHCGLDFNFDIHLSL